MATQPYQPERDIPSDFWESIAAVGASPDKLTALLACLDRDALLALFNTYLEARTELRDRLWEFPESADSSEDTVDDLADAIVTQGRECYLGVFYRRCPLPPEDEWEDMPLLLHVFSRVFYERFGESIYDYSDL